MSDVLPFKPLDPEPDDDAGGPSITGTAVCGACEHEWTSVAPVGSTHLQCPKCSRWWGTFKHAVEPERHWRCNCGETFFWLTPTGAMCRRCGTRSNDWAD